MMKTAGLVLTVAALTAGCAHAGQDTLEIMRKADQQTVEGPEEYFTGRATITGNFTREEPSRISGAIVTFEPGARTAWHTHPLGQTLIVTDGVGWTQVEGEERVEFYEGDIMLCPKDKPHWHGATRSARPEPGQPGPTRGRALHISVSFDATHMRGGSR